jgi:hypothetical protein
MFRALAFQPCSIRPQQQPEVAVPGHRLRQRSVCCICKLPPLALYICNSFAIRFDAFKLHYSDLPLLQQVTHTFSPVFQVICGFTPHRMS